MTGVSNFSLLFKMKCQWLLVAISGGLCLLCGISLNLNSTMQSWMRQLWENSMKFYVPLLVR